jgi:membrane protein implicated in regulation of membrane protease activity
VIPFLGVVDYWHWWALGGALAIVEAFLPGFVFLWLGVAAGLVGCLLWLWPGLGPDFQVLIFAALAVASVAGWRRWQTAYPAPSDQPNLNRRGAQYLRRQFDLVEPIAKGRGRIKLGDSSWMVTGPDLPAGQTVEVIGADGAVLQVRPLPGDRRPLRVKQRAPEPAAATALEGDAPPGRA